MLLEQRDYRDDDATLGYEGGEHPLQQAGLDIGNLHFEVGLDGCEFCFEVSTDAFYIDLDGCDIGFGGEVAVEELYLLVGEGLGLALGEAAGGEVSDESEGVEDDGFVHGRVRISRGEKVGKRRAGFLGGTPHPDPRDGFPTTRE